MLTYTYTRLFVGGESPIVKQTGVQDDPQRRRPDIKRAKLYLGWSPKVIFCILQFLDLFILYFEDTVYDYCLCFTGKVMYYKLMVVIYKIK